MSEPVMAQKAPYKVELEAGEYWWCACGKSASQPFCDGTHKTTDFIPLQFTIEDKKPYFICGCKHTANKPYCDGTHKKL
jgi:CDGSH-type Zn-finger protein